MTPHVYRDPCGLWVCCCAEVSVVAQTPEAALALAGAVL